MKNLLKNKWVWAGIVVVVVIIIASNGMWPEAAVDTAG
jgi:hypothetical protein